jgi:hypothetical protein
VVGVGYTVCTKSLVSISSQSSRTGACFFICIILLVCQGLGIVWQFVRMSSLVCGF